MRSEIVKDSRIAYKNDVFRKLGFGVTMTNGAAALPDIIGLMEHIRAYNDFTEASDPYFEHTTSVSWNGTAKRSSGRLTTTTIS